MTARPERICPPWLAPFLDNPLRRWLTGSRKLAQRHVRPGMTVLDFGCGPAPMLRDFLRAAAPDGRVVCADMQQAMLDHVARKARRAGLAGRVQLHLCGRDDADLPRGVADFAVAFWVLHETPDPAASLAQLRDCLKPGGHLLVAEPRMHTSPAAFAGLLAQARQAGLEEIEQPAVGLSRACLLHAI